MHELSHPLFLSSHQDWYKWRLTYEAKLEFKNKYLSKFSQRETNEDFNERRNISPIPGFARAAINEIKNSIFQRSHDVSRLGGHDSYTSAFKGFDGGVDFRGSSMNSFIGQKILPELLALGKVGVFVDMPQLDGDSLFDQSDSRPYLYVYQAEQIVNWHHDRQGRLRSVLLERNEFEIDEETQLPKGSVPHKESLLMFINQEGTVTVRKMTDKNKPDEPDRILNLTRIPLVVLELTDSLLRNAADYQIALLNLESSDIAYTLKANFPFYTEQYDPRAESIADYIEPDEKAVEGEAPARNAEEARLGATHGRRYSKDVTHPPAFIAPPVDPLRASMEKQERMKADIRLLVNLSVQNLKPGRNQSAESMKQDLGDLESGLSCIGLELERGESEIAAIWAEYVSGDTARVKYPETYVIKTPEQRQEEVASLSKEMTYIPHSLTYKREIAKKLAHVALGPTVDPAVFTRIEQEIDATTVLDTDSSAIQRDVELGIASRETAASARGYPEGEAAKANVEHAKRLALINASQSNDSGARGVDDLSVDPAEEAKNEKTTSQDRDSVAEGSPVRGDER